MGINFFSKCGILIFLFLFASFLVPGCIDLHSDSHRPDGPADRLQEGHVSGLSSEELASRLQLDFSAEVSSSLFRARGNLAVLGNQSLPYLLIDATLLRGEEVVLDTRYMLIQVEAGEDHGFDISKNARIPPAEYNCTLEISGPEGFIANETRRCSPLEVWTKKVPGQMTGELDGLQSWHGPRSQETPVAWEEEQEEVREEMRAKRPVEEGPSDGDQEDGVSSAESGSSGEEMTSGSGSRPVDDGQKGGGGAGKSSSSSGKSSLEEPKPSEDGPDGRLVASSSSKKYHRPDCRYAAKIKPENRIYFDSEQEARRQGYLPCKTCNP